MAGLDDGLPGGCGRDVGIGRLLLRDASLNPGLNWYRVGNAVGGSFMSRVHDALRRAEQSGVSPQPAGVIPQPAGAITQQASRPNLPGNGGGKGVANGAGAAVLDAG